MAGQGDAAASTRPRAEWVLVLAVLAGALLVRLWSLHHSGGVLGYVNSDDGTYFGASHAFVHGVLPYRDFVLLHPPGSTVVYAPVAALAPLVGEDTTFALARLAVIALGSLSAVLAYLTARRAGVVAAVTAGALYAVWFSAVYVERTTLLEPLQNLTLLAALALVARPLLSARGAMAVGVLLGLSVTVKLTSVLPMLVVLVWVFAVSGRRRGGQALVAAAAAAIVTAGPLLLVAPSAAWRMVVEDQAGRGALHIEPGRVLALVGATPDAAISRVLAAVLWAVIVAGIVLVWRTQPWARLWVWLLASETLLLLANGVMFRHYSAVLAPLVVLVLGAAVQVVLDATSTWSGTSRVVAVASTATVVLAIIAGQLVTVSDYGAGRRFPWAQVTPLVAGARCVTADSATPLILTGSMSTNIEQGCPVVVDFTGQLYETRGEPLVRRENQAWQRWALDYLSSGDRTILVRQVNDGFTAATLADLVDRPVLLEAKKLVVLGERR